jgi:ABC-2 type transport system permease protein
MQIKTQLAYTKSFVMEALASGLTSLFSLVSIYFLFSKFGNIRGYTFDDVVICYIISFFGFSFVELFFRGFDRFDLILSNGTFDMILIKPKPIMLQVMGANLGLKKIARMMIAVIALIILFFMEPQLLTWDKLLTIFNMALGTIIMYAGLFILKAGITFFTVQGLEIMNIFTDGTRDLTQYPLDVYKPGVLKFFTYIIPAALVNLYPLLYLIGRSDNKLYIFLPLVTIVMLIPCMLFWKFGVRKYKSTGS